MKENEPQVGGKLVAKTCGALQAGSPVGPGNVFLKVLSDVVRCFTLAQVGNRHQSTEVRLDHRMMFGKQLAERINEPFTEDQ
jgi:hypothetical protein